MCVDQSLGHILIYINLAQTNTFTYVMRYFSWKQTYLCLSFLHYDLRDGISKGVNSISGKGGGPHPPSGFWGNISLEL